MECIRRGDGVVTPILPQLHKIKLKISEIVGPNELYYSWKPYKCIREVIGLIPPPPLESRGKTSIYYHTICFCLCAKIPLTVHLLGSS